MSLYPTILPVVSQLVWFTIGSTVVLSCLGSMRARYSVPLFVFLSAVSVLNILGAVLNVVT